MCDELEDKTDVEVTPEMVEIGREVYAGFFLDLMKGEEEAPARMVECVFRAMFRRLPAEAKEYRVPALSEN